MNENTPPKKKSLPWNLIAILTVSIVPIFGAYIAYYTGIGVSDTTVNQGVLISATPAKNLQDLLKDATGDRPNFDKNYKWRIIIPISEQCNDDCKQNLYVTHQVHVRLSQKAERVERYVANLGGEIGEQFLESIAKEHFRLKHFSVSQEQWQAWVGGANIPEDMSETPYYILVNQVGFAMMYYTAKHEGNQLLKDVKRILRYSIEK